MIFLLVNNEIAIFIMTKKQHTLLICNNNDISTLLLLKQAIETDRTAGIVEYDDLKKLPHYTDDTLYPYKYALSTNDTPIGAHLLCCTSGTSDTPKMALRTYESWKQTFIMQRKKVPYHLDAKVTIVGKLSHSLHSYAALESLDRNKTPNIIKKFLPNTILKIFKNQATEITYLTPEQLNIILKWADYKKDITPIHSMQYVFIGGSKFTTQSINDFYTLFPKATIIEFFGSTETSYITMRTSADAVKSVGKACDGVEIKIMDDNGIQCKNRTEGFIWIKSPMLYERYILGEDKNTKRHNGFLTIGDKGYLDKEGNLFFTGRHGRMITIGGENVFLDSMEKNISMFITNMEYSIVPCYDARKGNKLVIATSEKISTKQEIDILKKLRSQYGALKTPKKIIHVKDWPYLPSGKTDRQALKKLIL